MRARLCLLLLVLGASACAPNTAPSSSPGNPTDSPRVNASAAAVWQALPAVYDSLGLEVDFASPERYTLASSEVRSLWRPVIGSWRAPYARCVVPSLVQGAAALLGVRVAGRGIPVQIPPGQVTFTVETALVPEEEGTRVVTRVLTSPVGLGMARMGAAPMSQGPYCVSTGRLERSIAQALERRLGPAPAPSA